MIYMILLPFRLIKLGIGLETQIFKKQSNFSIIVASTKEK